MIVSFFLLNVVSHVYHLTQGMTHDKHQASTNIFIVGVKRIVVQQCLAIPYIHCFIKTQYQYLTLKLEELMLSYKDLRKFNIFYKISQLDHKQVCCMITICRHCLRYWESSNKIQIDLLLLTFQSFVFCSMLHDVQKTEYAMSYLSSYVPHGDAGRTHCDFKRNNTMKDHRKTASASGWALRKRTSSRNTK